MPYTLGMVDGRYLAGWLESAARVHAARRPAELVEAALRREEGILLDNGALCVETGAKTGRSANDKFVVTTSGTEDEIWWGPAQSRVERMVFDALLDKALAHLGAKEVFVVDAFAGESAAHRQSVRVISERAWHALFARSLLIVPEEEIASAAAPALTVVQAGSLAAGGPAAGVRSDTFIGLDLERGLVLILGTEYAGEVKKSVFSFMNYLLPRRGVLTMHGSANVGRGGDTALFFGLSGTGKTTLSADPNRFLIGDDETAWADDGIFNIEGGCYAKCIDLRRDKEPQIWDAVRFGAVLENVGVKPGTRQPDYADARRTENTRAAYPTTFIAGALRPALGPHPRNVIFLTADAFGVLPPVARLDSRQAMYHYISGYTAKVAGTETGVTEPKATFSPCFGGPFLPLHPMRYAALLGERLGRHEAGCWLVNTGWTGGPFGTGKRMDITVSRAVITAILEGALEGAPTRRDPVFGLQVPQAVPGVPADLLEPRRTWRDPAAYDAKARELAGLFRNNFALYQGVCPPEVRAAGPG